MNTRFSLTTTFAAAAVSAALLFAASAPNASAVSAQSNDQVTAAGQKNSGQTYTSQEIITAGHKFFGSTTKGLAQAVEYAFQRAGRPNGYIVGEEGSGAFVGGVRYGEGTLFMKNGHSQKVFWQGPSVGFDFGGNGSRTLVLVYDMDTPHDIFSRFVGVEGSAYLVGGFGVSFQSNEKLKLAPIRTGVGARLGANVGYSKYTDRPTWNPF